MWRRPTRSSVRVGVELGPLLPARTAVRRAQPGGLDDAGRARPGDHTASPRRDGQRHAPSPSGGHGQHGGDARHHLRRPVRARHGRGLERDGVELPTASSSARSSSGSTASTRASRSSARCSTTRSPTSRATYFTVTDAWCEPKPVQAKLPLVIGGKGRTRTLKTVARFADQWDMTFPEHVGALARARRGPAWPLRRGRAAISTRSPGRSTSDSPRTPTPQQLVARAEELLRRWCRSRRVVDARGDASGACRAAGRRNLELIPGVAPQRCRARLSPHAAVSDRWT